jgi:anti-sigma regulatory factor (Ser/Thr protein kinase)
VRSARQFPCHPKAVTAARRFVREGVADRPVEVATAVELMASELVTNCVRHARSDFEITIESGSEIRVEVRDSGSGRPKLLSPSPDDRRGRGLHIVDALSDAWGITPVDGGKTVWFTLTPINS